jgi:AhpD family alkylhydroperoxidase
MSQRLRYAELAPEGITALRASEHYLNTGTTLPAVLRELIRLRASLLNGCTFCIEMHRHELAKHNEPLTRVDAIANWQASDAFTPRERAAFAWTDIVTNIQSTHASDEEYAAVNQFFTGKDLADLTLTIASINAWNRIAIPFRAEWNPHAHKPSTPADTPAAVNLGGHEVSAVDDDGGKVSED